MHGSTDYNLGYQDAASGLPCCPPDQSDTFLYRSGYRDGLAEWVQGQQQDVRSLAARLIPSARAGQGVLA